MARYIELDALVAEIEKCYNECLKRSKIIDSDYWNVKADAYRNVLTILNDTLEVKEVQEEHCTETEFREIEILRTKLFDIAKAIYYHEGKENPTVERIREIVQDCCFELMDLKKPKQEEPASEDLENAALEYATYYDKNWSEVKDGYIAENEVKAFKAGANWQKEQINEVLLSEVLPCFMHGGEADEVVAMLDDKIMKNE